MMSNGNTDKANLTQSELMAAALRQADAGIREFLTLWVEAQEPSEQARIEDLISNGLILGLHALATGAPRWEVTLTDAAGARRVISSVHLRHSTH
jgi:hypothetical protein